MTFALLLEMIIAYAKIRGQNGDLFYRRMEAVGGLYLSNYNSHMKSRAGFEIGAMEECRKWILRA